jgi:hypothetical protein
MAFFSIEEVAPQVIEGLGDVINVDDFNLVTGVAKYRGCFVRMRKRSGDDVNLPFDTIYLTNGAGWLPTETAGSYSYSNKPFGIIGSYPEKINDVGSGGIQGKLSIHLLGEHQPVYVAFRYVDGSYNYIQPTPDLVGKKLYIHGKQETINGNNYIVPVASQTSVSGASSFTVDRIITPPKLVGDLLGSQKDVGWVVLALDFNFISEPYWYP